MVGYEGTIALVDTEAHRAMPRAPKFRSACTQAGYRFQRQHLRIFDFFLFAVHLTTAADKVRFTAAKVLADGGEKDYVDSFEEVKQNPDPAFSKLKSFSDYNSELMIIRFVDNFTSFLSEILQECMTKRPELLRSREQVRTDDVLRFDNRRDLVDFLVNRKLNELSYGGLRGIEEFLEQRIGIDLIEKADERSELSVAIELRNIYTHNRGVVNELFLSRLADCQGLSKFVLRRRYHADFEEIIRLANNLFDVAHRLDGRALKKFALRNKRYKTWDDSRVADPSTKKSIQ